MRLFATRHPLGLWAEVTARTGSIAAAEVEIGRAGIDLALVRSAHWREMRGRDLWPGRTNCA